jgi:hypothetical protein
LIETCWEVEPFFDDGDQHIDRDSNPDLSFDGVLRRAEEDFDSKMLLDPFEKQFDLPPAYPSGEGRLFAEDVIVNIEGAAGTMIVSV